MAQTTDPRMVKAQAFRNSQENLEAKQRLVVGLMLGIGLLVSTLFFALHHLIIGTGFIIGTGLSVLIMTVLVRRVYNHNLARIWDEIDQMPRPE